jgi:MFS transporter, ACS family, D-galactonate transporter
MSSLATAADPLRSMPRPRFAGWGLVSLLVAFAFVGHFNRISMSVAGAEWIIPEQGISETQMGMVYSAYLFVYTLFMIPGGWVIDRWGGRFALAVMALASAGLVLSTGMAGLFMTGRRYYQRCSLFGLRWVL